MKLRHMLRWIQDLKGLSHNLSNWDESEEAHRERRDLLEHLRPCAKDSALSKDDPNREAIETDCGKALDSAVEKQTKGDYRGGLALVEFIIDCLSPILGSDHPLIRRAEAIRFDSEMYLKVQLAESILRTSRNEAASAVLDALDLTGIPQNLASASPMARVADFCENMVLPVKSMASSNWDRFTAESIQVYSRLAPQPNEQSIQLLALSDCLSKFLPVRYGSERFSDWKDRHWLYLAHFLMQAMNGTDPDNALKQE